MNLVRSRTRLRQTTTKHNLPATSQGMKNRVAVFDVDGTIFRSSLLIELTEALIAHGAFPLQARALYAGELARWRAREGEYERYIGAVIAAFERYIAGIPYSHLRDASRSVVRAEHNHVYRYTRDLARELKEKGYFLLAISQSPKAILDEFCKTVGFDKVYGRIYETDSENKCTGEVTDLHLIANKANIVRRAVEKENLTLRGSIGVGDTEGDIPFLEMVEKPICFNPNEKLYRYARLMKWTVVIERKDVIYKI